MSSLDGVAGGRGALNNIRRGVCRWGGGGAGGGSMKGGGVVRSIEESPVTSPSAISSAMAKTKINVGVWQSMGALNRQSSK